MNGIVVGNLGKLLIAVAIASMSACGSASHPSTAESNNTGTLWIPPQIAEWQWQLDNPPSSILPVAIYDIDGFDNSAQEVAKLHAKGIHLICYIDVGTWENFRPDASKFPASMLGSTNGWPGERWLDIRQLAVLEPIIDARLDMCKSKGFDAVEPDNIDGYENNTGFPLTAKDQLAYNEFVAQAAHQRGLSVGLKNDLDQVQALLPYFDWALDEQCFQYHECNELLPFVQGHKAVFEVEYNLQASQFCAKANAMDFNAMKKDINLDAYREACR